MCVYYCLRISAACEFSPSVAHLSRMCEDYWIRISAACEFSQNVAHLSRMCVYYCLRISAACEFSPSVAHLSRMCEDYWIRISAACEFSQTVAHLSRMCEYTGFAYQQRVNLAKRLHISAACARLLALHISSMRIWSNRCTSQPHVRVLLASHISSMRNQTDTAHFHFMATIFRHERVRRTCIYPAIGILTPLDGAGPFRPHLSWIQSPHY